MTNCNKKGSAPGSSLATQHANTQTGHCCVNKCGIRVHLPCLRAANADAPFKQTCFPQYAVPDALERYAEVADALNLGGKTEQEKVGCSRSTQCCSPCSLAY